MKNSLGIATVYLFLAGLAFALVTPAQAARQPRTIVIPPPAPAPEPVVSNP